jgi:hypothetical protein
VNKRFEEEIMKKAMSYLAMGAALYTVTALPSCASEDDAPVQKVTDKKTGTVSMLLQKQAPSGKIYRLRQAVFPISPLGSASGGGPFVDEGEDFPVFQDGGSAGASPAGGSPGSGGAFPAGGSPATGGVDGTGGFATGGFGTGGFFPPPGGSVITLNSEDNPNSLTLDAFLVPSFYQIQLLDGWFMEQVDELLGTSVIVPAQLLSSSFQFFNIESNITTSVEFVFLVDNTSVTFGPPGRLSVGIQVIEQSCGDGIVGPGESCDSGDFLGQDCASATFGQFPLGFLQCTSFCQIDTSFCFGGAGGSPGFDGGAGGSPIFPDAGFGGFGGSGGFSGGDFDGGTGGAASSGGKGGGKGGGKSGSIP